jgi:ribosome-associated translation inhibitor RaiA
MEQPIQVTFRGLPVSDAVENACLDEVAKLERYYDRITSCHVIIAEPHRQHRKGNLFEVSIELGLPGDTLAVKRLPDQHQSAEDVYVVLRESFAKARRQLEDWVRRRRGQVKAHQPRR